MASRSEGASARSTAQQSMFDSEESAGAPARKSTARASANMEGTKSLERLRDRINLAVKELKRLREENGTLRKELKSLRKARSVPEEGSVIHFNESPSRLREEIQALIDALDDRIEQARDSNDD